MLRFPIDNWFQSSGLLGRLESADKTRLITAQSLLNELSEAKTEDQIRSRLAGTDIIPGQIPESGPLGAAERAHLVLANREERSADVALLLVRALINRLQQD